MSRKTVVLFHTADSNSPKAAFVIETPETVEVELMSRLDEITEVISSFRKDVKRMSGSTIVTSSYCDFDVYLMLLHKQKVMPPQEDCIFDCRSMINYGMTFTQVCSVEDVEDIALEQLHKEK